MQDSKYEEGRDICSESEKTEEVTTP